MVVFPNAKINLGLRVVERRRDGFHNIESVFIPTNLYDVLEFIPSENDSPTLHVTGITPDGKSDDNLVMKAWQYMHSKYKIPPVEIHLHKVIPIGAGLGGGSADAAFMLKGLNDYFHCGCTPEELCKGAATLGSDCAFFINNKPALATGRGEILEPVNLSLENYEILLVNPGIHVATGTAYAGTVPAKPADSLKELIALPVTQWQQCLVNDFEISVFRKHPEIEVIKNTLIKKGAEYAAMSGSGSTVFALFKEDKIPDVIEEFSGYFLWKGVLRAADLTNS